MPGSRPYLAIQTVLPPDYRRDRDFIRALEALREAGYDGVELNIRDPRKEDPQALAAFLAGFGLSFSMLATGLAAKAEGLSLAAADEQRRRESVQWTAESLDFASRIGGGVIAGFLKGAMEESTPAHLAQLRRSIAEIAPEARRLKTPFLVEAVNRFESPLGHSLAEVHGLIGENAGPFVQILPDTWHMSIEEEHIEASLVRYRGQFSSIHLSDSNRFFPGCGSLDFGRIIGVLDAMGYQGKLAIEGNVKSTFIEDARRSAEYLRAVMGAG